MYPVKPRKTAPVSRFNAFLMSGISVACLALGGCGLGQSHAEFDVEVEKDGIYTQVETKPSCDPKVAKVFRECAQAILEDTPLTLAEVESLTKTCASGQAKPIHSPDDLFEIERMRTRAACL